MTITYECSICLEINHVSRYHCKSCGTIPANYSILRKPARIIEDIEYVRFIPVISAIGVDRTERHRTCKRVLRTVSLDYYADSD